VWQAILRQEAAIAKSKQEEEAATEAMVANEARKKVVNEGIRESQEQDKERRITRWTSGERVK
jgi:hypothetical protein